MSISIHRPNTSETVKALELAMRVFTEFEMPDYETEAFANFQLAMGSENMFVACDDETVVGMINERGAGHVSMLFVDGGYHRHGIGTALLNAIIDDLKSRGIFAITLNSSPYGIPFYEHLGFKAMTEMQHKDGFLYLPMEYTM
jgi:ribosomal protein S18 acetylase RimI-like enzyme